MVTMDETGPELRGDPSISSSCAAQPEWLRQIQHRAQEESQKLTTLRCLPKKSELFHIVLSDRAIRQLWR